MKNKLLKAWIEFKKLLLKITLKKVSKWVCSISKKAKKRVHSASINKLFS